MGIFKTKIRELAERPVLFLRIEIKPLINIRIGIGLFWGTILTAAAILIIKFL